MATFECSDLLVHLLETLPPSKYYLFDYPEEEKVGIVDDLYHLSDAAVMMYITIDCDTKSTFFDAVHAAWEKIETVRGKPVKHYADSALHTS